jgi:NAD+-dependent protein deacetylase sirtuin 4
MKAPVALVPTSEPDWRERTEALAEQLRGKRFALLTGAGCSTESGIPDYRGEETARRARNPIQFREFLADPEGRRRYWARSTVGWPWFRARSPNEAHRAAAELEGHGLVSGIITQNVDRLHQRGGAKHVIELHGALEDVVCLDCGALEHRDDLQARTLAQNPDFFEESAEMAPDGDAELELHKVQRFRVVGCPACGGTQKPRVVFFGEGVPKPTVDAAYAALESTDALLVVGSSLTVFSGYRFVRRAQEKNLPVYVVNVGVTRADPVAQLRISGKASDVLGALKQALIESPPLRSVGESSP